MPTPPLTLDPAILDKASEAGLVLAQFTDPRTRGYRPGQPVAPGRTPQGGRGGTFYIVAYDGCVAHNYDALEAEASRLGARIRVIEGHPDNDFPLRKIGIQAGGRPIPGTIEWPASNAEARQIAANYGLTVGSSLVAVLDASGRQMGRPMSVGSLSRFNWPAPAQGRSY